MLRSSTSTPLKVGYLPLLMLFGFLALAGVMDLLPDFDRYNEKRIVQIAVLLSIVMFMLWRRYADCLTTQLTLFSGRTRLLWAAILVAGIGSSLYGASLKYAVLEVSLYVLMFFSILAVACTRHLLGATSDRAFINLVAVAIGLNVVAVLFSLLAAFVVGTTLDIQGLFINYSNIRFFNQLQTWLLPLAVLPALIYRKYRVIYFVLLALSSCWWFLLYLSAGRGTLISVVVGLATVLIIYRQHSHKFILLHAVSAALGVLIYMPVLMKLASQQSVAAKAVIGQTVGKPLGAEPRLFMWDRAWQFVQENPLLGSGPMHYACDAGNRLSAHPHNMFLQIASEWGLPAAAILVFLLVSGLLLWIKQSRVLIKDADHMRTALYLGLTGSIIAAVLHSMLSGILVMPLSQMTMVAVAGWMVGMYYSGRVAGEVNRMPSWLPVILIVFAIAGVLQGIYPDVRNLYEQQQEFQQLNQQKWILPRFWLQGKIC